MATKALPVGNMAYSSTDATLAEAFAAYHPSGTRVVANRGYGFVDVAEDQVAMAILGVNGVLLDGRALQVTEANPRGGGSKSGALQEAGQ